MTQIYSRGQYAAYQLVQKLRRGGLRTGPKIAKLLLKRNVKIGDAEYGFRENGYVCRYEVLPNGKKILHVSKQKMNRPGVDTIQLSIRRGALEFKGIVWRTKKK
ncbi:MAG: hypothetical protein UT26_C0058G0004 [Microgenomates group bacterium GW2011_GWC1_39_12]|nr:MAG: hypothetical protein UT26_C0058G0004 [Microgenomates group bacterium GW2011_GWC1_39_12]